MPEVITLIGENVRKYRESKGLTQQGLADLAGLHRNYILSIEKSDRNLSVLTLEKIATALDIDIRRLFDEDVQY
jgi:transcriptional regulator with XRE-family HTH domain